MNYLMEYKGYFGEFNYYAEDNGFYGKLVGLEHALIMFEGDTLTEFLEDFIGAVDDYLEIKSEYHPQKTDMSKIHGLIIPVSVLQSEEVFALA